MSDTFNPGDGWREVEYDDSDNDTEVIQHWVPGEGRWRTWVREEPVPPLPTEPYTVIRVTWRSGEEPNAYTDGTSNLFLDESGWALNAIRISAVDLQNRITGFEVLAEPVSVARS